MRKILSIFLVLFPLFLNAQQNHTLYQMHYLGESNFLNPAVQCECKWFIGLPLISSIHLNYANSGFSYRSLVENTGPTTASLQLDEVLNNMGRRTFIGTEIHLTILALGYKFRDYYFNFSIIEKNNIPLTFSKDIFSLAWGGNTQFEGEEASTRGTAAYATHYREYALGVSKNTGYNNFWGVKGKLLFGKLNLSSPQSNISLYTDPGTFDLTVTSDLLVNISAPVILEENNGQPNSIAVLPDENMDIYQLIFNRQNWGVAFDAGFIRQLNEKTSLSGSALDLGFIGWRSYLNNVSAEEEFSYYGVLADTNSFLSSVMDSVDLDITHDSYYTMLPVKLYLGLEYAWLEKLSARAMASAVIYRTKFMPSLTLALDYNPFRNFHLVGSYSLMYRSYNNVGMGLSIGRGPVQFYAVTDNLAGMIWPLSARNLNLRFGLNINLGCRAKKERPENLSSPGYIECPAYMNAIERQRRR
jgi:hypothetical protein